MNSPNYALVDCPLCGSAKSNVYVMAPSHYGPERHQVTRCEGCGMIFTNPQLVTYEEQVQGTGVLGRHLESDRLHRASLQALVQLKLIGQYVKGEKLFDFGCGAGALVHQALELGWEAVGLDLNRGLVEAANQHWGFQALQSACLDTFLECWPGKFNAIVSNQVFEHLQDPRKIGRLLADRLETGGVLLIDVPNVNQPQEWFSRGKTLDPTSHWCHFSTDTLGKLMLSIGLEPVYVSASPALAGIYSRFLPMPVAASAGKVTKAILPAIGTGVCVIARKRP